MIAPCVPLVAPMVNSIRDYDWGSTSAIADLQSRYPTGGPEAELWMGTHPDAPSRLILPGGGTRSLLELVTYHPEHTLGPTVHAQLGTRLPFLLKLLAADSPLSLQAHPTAEQARSGFELEEREGIPRTMPTASSRIPTPSRSWSSR